MEKRVSVPRFLTRRWLDGGEGSFWPGTFGIRKIEMAKRRQGTINAAVWVVFSIVRPMSHGEKIPPEMAIRSFNALNENSRLLVTSNGTRESRPIEKKSEATIKHR